MQRARNNTYTRIVLVAILPIIGLVGSVQQSCFPVEGGLNANEQGPGNQDGGIDLSASASQRFRGNERPRDLYKIHEAGSHI